MISYNNLAVLLQGLESRFGGNRVAIPPAPLAPLVATATSGWHHENIQFFVLDDSTAMQDEELPVVVLVGANYTQQDETPGPKLPTVATAIALKPSPPGTTTAFPSRSPAVSHGHLFVEDHDPRIFRGIRTKLKNPKHANSPAKHLSDFHLVFTNLVPWVTIDAWGDILKSNRDLLVAEAKLPSASAPITYVGALAGALGGSVAVWVGHTASLKPEFVALLGTSGLSLYPRYSSWNLSRCAPHFMPIP